LKDEHILGLTNVHFEKDRICKACQAGKQVGAPHPPNNILTTSSPLELIHMDLFGPVAYISIGGNKYGLVIVDDYSRFTWVFFMFDKSEVQGKVKTFIRRAQREFGLPIKKVRSDNGSEFRNTYVEEFLNEEGIKHEFSAPYTPQQNGWLRGRIELLLRWQEPCWMSTRLKTSFGPKLLTRLAMPSTASIFTSFRRRSPMSLSPVKSPRCLTLECLGANVSF
jgi:hypothetical protein